MNLFNLQEDIPEIFKMAAEDILMYFININSVDIKLLLEKINSCKYILYTDNEEKFRITHEIIKDGFTLKYDVPMPKGVFGLYKPIIHVLNSGEYVKKDVVIIDTNKIPFKAKEAKDKILRITAIHEILHMLFTKIENDKIKIGFLEMDIIKKSNSVFLDFTNPKNLCINEAATDYFSFKIYNEITGENLFEVIELEDNSFIEYKTIYYISSQLYKLLDILSGNTMQMYITNDTEKYISKVREHIKISLEEMDGIFELLDKSYKLSRISASEEKRKESTCILLQLMSIVTNRFYNKDYVTSKIKEIYF